MGKDIGPSRESVYSLISTDYEKLIMKKGSRERNSAMAGRNREKLKSFLKKLKN
jgi:hypothetical protein